MLLMIDTYTYDLLINEEKYQAALQCLKDKKNNF